MPKIKPVNTDDPGARICGHDHRIHYLGGGLWVCFACWVKTVAGPRHIDPPGVLRIRDEGDRRVITLTGVHDEGENQPPPKKRVTKRRSVQPVAKRRNV